MTRVAEFEELRPLLFAIAYRILGSVTEAEDAVQETWLRYEPVPEPPASAKAFLAAVVTRVAIDVLRSARVRRETYVGEWFPEPLLADPYQDPQRSAELADSVSTAALLLLERLSPLERAVFVLRDVFGFGFAEIAAAVGRSEAACRQLAVRARHHMEAGRPRFETDRRVRAQLAARFFDALRDGDVAGLRELLAADVQMLGDGGGKGPALARASPAPTTWSGSSRRSSRSSTGSTPGSNRARSTAVRVRWSATGTATWSPRWCWTCSAAGSRRSARWSIPISSHIWARSATRGRSPAT